MQKTPTLEYGYIEYNGFTICYNNEESARQTIDEVFNSRHYFFETSKKSPLIIDAGSNIGIATLFFKKHYPHSKILCFEPDPNAFEVLKKNVELNQLKDIKLINAAVSKIEGTIDFFGQINVECPDARGNSIIDLWGSQRNIVNTIQVQSVKLSKYISSEVDFLKLDIEGAEEQVLNEIKDKLKMVKALAIEFHEAELMQSINNLDRVKSLLEDYSFSCEVLSNDIGVLPEPVRAWAKKLNPHLYTIQAVQKL